MEGRSSLLRAPSGEKKRSAARSIHASAPSPTARIAWNSWLGWQSGTFLPTPAARSGRGDKNTLSVPRSLPVLPGCVPLPRGGAAMQAVTTTLPWGLQGEVGNRQKGLFIPFPIFNPACM